MREFIVREARSWIGTPYSHQARLKGVGVDCAGLPICIARELGMVDHLFDITGYGRVPDGTSLVANCDRWMTRIDEPELGAVIVTRFRMGGHPQHLGILADYRHGGFSMVHAMGLSDGKGRVVEHRLDAATLARTEGFWRMPGVV